MLTFKKKNRYISRFNIIFFILSIIVVFYTTSPCIAQESTDIYLAPLNLDFLRYLQELQIDRVQQWIEDRYMLGLIPSPLDLSHLEGQKIFQAHQLLGFPTSYDLRTQGKLTPIKDQGNCGSCWAFATYGSLESNLLPSETWDFSENNLKNTHGFDWRHCDGGNADMSTAYLARWSGPVNESDDPYNPASGTSPSGLIARKHVQEVLIIPDRGGPLDNDNIKQAVMTYGAVYTTMYWGSSYYKSSNYAYYYSGTSSSNHAVAIVGWDDNFDKSNFLTSPPGNGAFVIKNSWGTGWGENGYFYISYYDSKIGRSNYLFNNAESTSNYSRAYQYDPLGWTTSCGYGNPTGWFANIFMATEDDLVSAVSFYVASLNSSYEIYVYENVNLGPTSGSLAGSKTGTIASPGYHTIILDSPISLTSGQKFSIVVKLTTPNYNFPIPIEYPVSGYSGRAMAHSGESYISSDGSFWEDVTAYYSNTNVCLKAFSIDIASPTASIAINNGASYTNSTNVTLTLSAYDPSGVSQMCISNTTSCSSWETYTISKSWTLPSGDGDKTVYAWFMDGDGNANTLPYSDSIIVDTTSPSDGSLSATPGEGQVKLSWSGFSDDLSGIAKYKLLYSTSEIPSSCLSGTQIYSGSGTFYTHRGLTNITYYYRVCASDNAGNMSTGSTASATPRAPEVISLHSPPNNAVFNSCSLIANYQPLFIWTVSERFRKYTIFFSKSSPDFRDTIARVDIPDAKNSWTPSAMVWKKIMTSSYNRGSVRDIYWKVVGTKSGKAAESEVRSLRIGSPQGVTISAPRDGAILSSNVPPTFSFSSNCNTKFWLEFSSIQDFGDHTKIVGLVYTTEDPNIETNIRQTLTVFQWTAIKNMIGTGIGYFRIRARDEINRETMSEVRSFSIQ